MKSKLTFLLFFVALTIGAQTRMAILGDSYSTYQGYITPATNEPWYLCNNDNPERTNVNDVTLTWWYQLIAQTGYRLEINNSYSGATICFTGYNGDDYQPRSIITRADNLGSPDVILVFGGTNASWANSPIGEYKYSGWTNEDLYNYRPAICYLAEYLKNRYQGVKVFFIINTELKPEITDGIKHVCERYGHSFIELHDITKMWGHPDINGMKAICEQVKTALEK